MLFGSNAGKNTCDFRCSSKSSSKFTFGMLYNSISHNSFADMCLATSNRGIGLIITNFLCVILFESNLYADSILSNISAINFVFPACVAPKTNMWLGNDSCFAEVFLDGDVIGFSSSSLRSSRPDVARFVGCLPSGLTS